MKSKYQEKIEAIIPGQVISNWKILDNYLVKKRGRSFVKCVCNKCKNIIALIRVEDLFTGHSKQCTKCALKAKGQHVYFTYKGIISSVFHKIKKGAKERNLVFEITMEDIGDLFEKQKGKCALSGLPLKLKEHSKDKNSTASLDRIDSTKGYLKDNVQWIYRRINFMKGALDENEFVYLCNKIVENKIKNNDIRRIPKKYIRNSI